jgi:cell division protein FtsA
MQNLSNIIAAIDIGTTKIVAIVGKKNENGKVEILRLSKALSKGIKRGVVINIKETVAAIRATVEDVQKISGIEFSDVFVGFAGRHIRSMKNSGSVIRNINDGFITKEEVFKLIESIRTVYIDTGEEVVDVIPQNFVVDNEIEIKSPIGMFGTRLEASIYIVIGQIAANYSIENCMKKANLTVKEFIPDSLASAEAVLTNEEKVAGVIVVDIGGGTTDIVIYHDNIIRHLAVIPFGGNLITKDIMDGCAIIKRHAEQLKIQYGAALGDLAPEDKVVSIPGISGREPKEISFKSLAYIIQARMEELIDAIKFEIQISGYSDKLAAGIVITGGGSMLRNLPQLMKYKTAMNVRIGVPSEHLAESAKIEINQPMYAASVGLILKGFECLETSTGNVYDTLDDFEFENKLSEFKYKEAKELLLKKIKDKDKIMELATKYSFLLDNEKLEKDKYNKYNDVVRYLTNIWVILGKNKIFNILDEKHFSKITNRGNETVFLKNIENENIKFQDSKVNKITGSKKSEEIGEFLEKNVIELFEHIFTINKETKGQILTKLRQQKRGTQYGFDIEFNCSIRGKDELIGLIECKNLHSQKSITIDTISNKLLLQIVKPENKLDFWILISPYLDPSNELNEYIKHLNDKFNINFQIWSPETFVDEFFGIVPEIYEKFDFRPRPNFKHPNTWTEVERNNIVEKWKLKLIPQIDLPKNFKSYLRNPSNFLLNNEKDYSNEFDKLYHNHIKRFCYDDSDEVTELELDKVVWNWLNTPVNQEPTMFLLGDFGDGKSTYTYILCRQLSDKMIENPKTSWIPIRFTLKNFSYEDERKRYNFLEESLDQIGLTLNDWHDILSKHKDRLLLILDGFDEISKNMDYATISNNFDKLINYYNEYFNNLKVLITSRKHFLSHSSQKERLLGRLSNPQLFHLLPFERTSVIDHLNENIISKEDISKLEKLKDFYDPIGLATKPLFLDMLKIALKDLPEQDINEIILYNSYIKKCLSRKVDQIDKGDILIGYDNILANLIEILKKIAIELHIQKSEFIYLSDISNENKGLKYAEKLWEMTKSDNIVEDDATSRIAVRSLLTRINVHKTSSEKKWPVDFFHRSLKEYFVALGLFDMLNYNISGLCTYLKETSLNYEIINFLSKLMNESKIDYLNKLLFLIYETKNIPGSRVSQNYANLGCNAVNILYTYRKELPGIDWNNLLLDGANLSEADLTGKNFSYTYLRHANLDNAIFRNSNFSYANLEGVKIEETSEIISIAVMKQSDYFYALYDDLTIKEWVYKNKIKQHPLSLIKFDNNLSFGKIFLIDNNTFLYILKDRILIFKKDTNNTIYNQSVINYNNNISIYKLKWDFILIVNTTNPNNKLLNIIDIKKRELIYSTDYKIDEIYENLDDEVLVLYNKTDGLHLNPMDMKKEMKIKIESSDNVSFITSFKISKNSYLLATGHKNGTIQIFSISKEESIWQVEKIFLDTCHSEIVKEIVFIDQYNILTSSSDKKICHTTFQKDSLKANCKNYFFLKVKCNGMNINGLKEETEYRRFLEFIRMEDIE